MKYEDFVCFIQTEMKEKLGEEVHVELHQIIKNNSVVLDGLSIQDKGCGIAPTIYLNDFYEEYCKGMTMPEILDCITSIYQKSKVKKNFDTKFYTDYERVRSRLACKIINREKNEELLKRVPHILFLDMAIVLYYKMSDSKMGNGTILVYESHRKNWGVSREQLFREAKENTLRMLPVELMSMKSVLEGYLQEENEEENSTGRNAGAGTGREDEIPMYILTNQENYFGAVNMIFDSVLEEAGMKLGQDFWVLPSSVHECILVPADAHTEKERLEAMVQQVNANEVMPEEYLSDSVYFYQRELHKLEKV